MSSCRYSLAYSISLQIGRSWIMCRLMPYIHTHRPTLKTALGVYRILRILYAFELVANYRDAITCDSRHRDGSNTRPHLGKYSTFSVFQSNQFDDDFHYLHDMSMPQFISTSMPRWCEWRRMNAITNTCWQQLKIASDSKDETNETAQREIVVNREQIYALAFVSTTLRHGHVNAFVYIRRSILASLRTTLENPIGCNPI